MWKFEGTYYTRVAFYNILVNKGQTIRLSETNKDYIEEYSQGSGLTGYPIFVDDDNVCYAVMKG